MYRQAWSVSLLLAWLGMTGCASIIHGITQDVGITSVPTGAAVSIDHISHGRTPVMATLSRKANHLVRMELAGYHPFEAILTQAVSGWVWGNIVFGGVIGVGVDALSGGFYRLAPEQVTATLLPLSEPSLAQAPSAQAVVSVPAPESVLIPVPGFTIRGTGWGEAWSLSLPAFRLDSVPVTNRVFLTFVLAHPQWLKSQVPATAHDGGYLRHWSGDTGLASGELDRPVVHVSFTAARAFCQSRGLKVPRFNHYRAAAPLPAIEEVALTYEAPYTAPQWAFVQTEWTDGTWGEEATQGMRIVYRHGTKHRGGRRSRDYTPMVDMRTTSPALGFRCAGPGGEAGPAGSS